jgi:flagellar hook-associated protein 1 FlgK
VTGGNLAGLFQTINTVSGYQSQLDTLANNLRTQVNGLETTGMTNEDPPTAGVDFFNDVPAGQPQTGAIDFAVNTQIQADPNMISAGTSGSAGDGGLAQNIADLQNTAIAGLGNQTFGTYYDNFASKVGSDVQNYTTQDTSQSAVLTQINAQVQSNSGVSLDDEMSNMLVYQRSYEAAAKALTIFDQVTSDLIAMMQS